MALAAGGMSALAAAVAAAALISLIVNHPDQMVLAMSNGDILDVVTLVLRQVASVCVQVLRLL